MIPTVVLIRMTDTTDVVLLAVLSAADSEVMVLVVLMEVLAHGSTLPNCDDCETR